MMHIDPPKAVRKSTVRASAASDACDGLLSSAKGKRFRLSDLSVLVYPFTSPRSHQAAAEHARKLIAAAAKVGRVKRHGHLHWGAVEISAGRTLRDGRVVSVIEGTHKLSITTHAVGKWAAVDLETGEVYEGSATGWKQASPATLNSLQAVTGAFKTLA